MADEASSSSAAATGSHDKDKDKDKDGAAAASSSSSSSSGGHRKHISANFLLNLPSTSTAMSFVTRPRSKSSLSKFFVDQMGARHSKEEKDLSTNPSLPQNNYGSKPRKFFGMPIPLDEDLLVDGIPRVVYRCVQNLRARGLTSEGLFRVPGSAADMKLLREAYENGDDPDLAQVRGANTIASMLKAYLRELPDPVITFDNYDVFIAVAGIPVPEERILKTKKAVELLPETNRLILMFLIPFLQEVAAKSDLNKMHVENLAKVFAPTLLRSSGSAVEEARDTQFTCQVVKDFIDKYDQIFGDFEVPANFANEPGTGISNTTLSRRQSAMTEANRKVASFLSDVRHSRFDAVRQALESGEADVNAMDSRNWTALMYASNSDEKEIAEYLIQKGANLDLQNDRKETALYRAASKGASQCAKLLINAGADIRKIDANGRTPFLIAAFAGSKKICGYLLKKHCDVNLMDDSNKTALSLAAYSGHKDVCNLLIEHGANLDLPDSFGWSPLMMAAFTGSAPVVALLLEKGANREQTTRKGKTAVSIAREQHNDEIAKIIENYIPGTPLSATAAKADRAVGVSRSKSISGKIRSAESTPTKSGSRDKLEKSGKEHKREKEAKDDMAGAAPPPAPLSVKELKRRNRRSEVLTSSSMGGLDFDNHDDSAHSSPASRRISTEDSGASNGDSPKRKDRRPLSVDDSVLNSSSSSNSSPYGGATRRRNSNLRRTSQNSSPVAAAVPATADEGDTGIVEKT